MKASPPGKTAAFRPAETLLQRATNRVDPFQPRFVVGTRSKQTDQILRFYRSHGFTPWSIQFFR
jgi:hypothetical protein